MAAVPDTVTHDEIAHLFQATDARLAALAQAQARTDEQLKRTDEQLQRTDEQLQRTDRRVEEMAAEEMERRRRLENLLADLKVRVDRTTRNVDAITDKWGRFVEGIVAPAAKTLFAARGIAVHRVSHRVEGERAGLVTEIDVLVENDNDVVAIEAKSTLRQTDIDEHLERLGLIKTIFPKLAAMRLIGAVAGVDVPPDVARYAYRRGLFVLLPSGETMRIANDAGFRPAIW